jgi:exopolysaccharide biosynthesis polyprenyl glycosylphosphotransferase
VAGGARPPVTSQLREFRLVSLENDLELHANGAGSSTLPASTLRVTAADRGTRFKLLVLLGDLLVGALAVSAGAWLGHSFGHEVPSTAAFVVALVALVICWVAGLFSTHAYTFLPARGRLVWGLQVTWGVIGGTLAALALSFLFSPHHLLERPTYLFAGLVAILLLWQVRLLAVRYGPPAQVRSRLLILGTGPRSRALVGALASINPHCAQVLGALRVEGETEEPEYPCPVLGDTEDADRLVEELQANMLVITPQTPVTAAVAHCAAHCDAMGLGVWTMERAYEELTWRSPVFHMGESWQANLEGTGRGRYTMRLKRLLDLGLTLLFMPLALLIIGVCALLIKILSPGPVFYRQERVGKDGKTFTFLKLRTMVVDAEKATGPVWAKKDDPRVTPLGRFMRKTRLDEVPQLFLVLRGDMSLVGPRPERPFFVEKFMQEIPLYDRRLMVRPGITGWAQIHHNYDRDLDDVIEKLRYDLYYIGHLSFSLDLRILLKTLGVMIRTKGAH